MDKSELSKGRNLITGDTHGDFAKLMRITKHIKEGDVLWIAGDFGFLFENDSSEQMLLNDLFFFLKRKKAYIAFVDGNHENHAVLNQLPVEIWHGAKVHKLRPNIIHVLRGEVVEINDKKIFCFGGAFSIDREYRELNVSYWEEELPTENDYKNGIHNLEKHNYQVDYIVTHTCPYETVNLLNLRHIAAEEYPLQNYLEWIRQKVEYKRFYFGHWHLDKELWRNQRVIFNDIVNMETGQRNIAEITDSICQTKGN